MSDITVFVGANGQFKGREYVVGFGDDGAVTVSVVIRRRPVNSRGFYQNEVVYRRLKQGSSNFRAALAEAKYRVALSEKGNFA